MDAVVRPKKNGYPPYMIADRWRGGFVVKNPLTGKRKRFKDETEARKTATALAELVRLRRERQLIEGHRPTVRTLVERWLAEKINDQPWDESTRQTCRMRLARIEREMGDRVLEGLTSLDIAEWLGNTAKRADPWNKWRHVWVLLYRFAVAQRMVKSNEAEKVEQRSTSRKIPSNRKNRAQLDVAGYKAIYAEAPPWLQLAMDLSLVTLQSRKEVCAMRHEHFKDGWLYVVRDKVAGDSTEAFIRIRVTPEIEALRARARTLDDVVSPYLLHRRPDRMQERWLKGKDHWTRIDETYLTRAFKAARNKVPQYAAMPERQRPTFHEIRGLGARLHEARGMPKADIRDLMTHSSVRTTAIYLERGRDGLTEADYKSVNAPFSLKELLS